MKPRKPLPRKRAKPRRYKTPRCIWGRCKKPQAHIERCVVHAKRYLDTLRAALVRTDHCEINHRDASWVGTPFACAGAICDNHGFDRDEMPARWELWNGFSGCSAVNLWANRNKIRWDEYLRRTWGDEVYAARRQHALYGPNPDYSAYLVMLEELSGPEIR